MKLSNDLLCAPRPWQEWEEIPAGLWDDSDIGNEKIRLSADLLSNPQEFKNVALDLVRTWTISACAHLSDRRRGRRAWIGQASCCFSHGANRWETIAAWMNMPLLARTTANDVALEVILGWEHQMRIGGQGELFPQAN